MSSDPKILVLSFTDAKICIGDVKLRKPTDKISSSYSGAVRDRTNEDVYSTSKDTLALGAVANMMHVLMGEKPKPRSRPSMVELDTSIVDLCRKAKVRVHNVDLICEELMTARKSGQWSNAKHDCTMFLDGHYEKITGGLLTLDRLERIVGSDLFELMMNMASLFTGDKPSTAIECIQTLNKNNKDNMVVELSDWLKEQNGLTSIYNLINWKHGQKNGSIGYADNRSRRNWENNTCLAVEKGVELMRRISGTIYVPITEKFIKRLQNGSGVATLLDGGLVSICGLEEDCYSLTFGAKEVDTGVPLSCF